MTKVVYVENEFSRQAGPRLMYGWVSLLVDVSQRFKYESCFEWPPEYDEERYDTAVKKGVLDALSELGFENPIGHFRLKEARFSTDDLANVPYAYREATKQAVMEVLGDGNAGGNAGTRAI